MADANFPFPSTLGKVEIQTSVVGNLELHFMMVFRRWWQFFYFFIMADINFLLLLILGKAETQTLGVGN